MSTEGWRYLVEKGQDEVLVTNATKHAATDTEPSVRIAALNTLTSIVSERFDPASFCSQYKVMVER
jgi:hypothetical protein